MNDEHGFLKHAQEHGYLYAMFLAALSFVSSWFTRRSKLQRVRQDQDSKRSAQIWGEAGELRAEWKDRVEKLERREAELLMTIAKSAAEYSAEIAELQRQVFEGALQRAKGDAQWDALVRDLQSRPGDEWAHLKIRNGGTKEVKEAKSKEVKEP